MNLTIRAGAQSAAATHLLEASVLGDTLRARGGWWTPGSDGLHVTVLDYVLESLSSGERLLWQVLADIADLGLGVSLLSLADRLDARNLAAVHDAIAVLFGLPVAVTA